MIACMLVLIATSLIVIAIVAVVALQQYRRPVEEPTYTPELHTQPRRYPDVYIPIPCGIAVTFDGRTDNCARRRRHQGRCMCEDELAVAADQVMLVPAPQDAQREAALQRLARHVDGRPSSLYVDGKLSAEEREWIATTCQLLDGVTNGETFDWGPTRA